MDRGLPGGVPIFPLPRGVHRIHESGKPSLTERLSSQSHPGPGLPAHALDRQREVGWPDSK